MIRLYMMLTNHYQLDSQSTGQVKLVLMELLTLDRLIYIYHIPNFILMAPSNEDELCDCVATSEINNQPSAFRYPRGEGGIASRKSNYMEYWKSKCN